MLGETLVGPLWVFWFFGVVPTVWTLSGGALLLLTLVGHEIAGMRKEVRSSASLGEGLLGQGLDSSPAWALTWPKSWSPQRPSLTAAASQAAAPQHLAVHYTKPMSGSGRSRSGSSLGDEAIADDDDASYRYQKA